MNARTRIEGIQTQIGLEIKFWRETRDISFLVLAKRAGISKSNLSKIERGIGNPTIETIVKLSRVLRIGFSDLVKDPTH